MHFNGEPEFEGASEKDYSAGEKKSDRVNEFIRYLKSRSEGISKG